ncbi:uncharacterized protein LODBEIA_P28150 [Lodderomyces beijingensis]|uniref:glutaminase n=1 Tax=Lodderomyces beijingensis TaxID=1775926 RepID=A0ABP0ZKC0_9ASCO
MTTKKRITIGVLALQGAFREHITYFTEVLSRNEEKYLDFAITIIAVRAAEELQKTDALVIPGGESSSISYIAERTHLLPHLYEYVADESKAIWGTCAGLIFLSSQIRNGIEDQKCLGGLSVEAIRNAFGRQLDSFIETLDFSNFIPGCDNFPTVFIRAPVVSKVLTTETENNPAKVIRSENKYRNQSKVQILHSLDNFDGKNNDLIVAVRQGRILGTSFHPELADDCRFHEWFIDEFVVKRA